ncbi:prolyl oligopeptidase family serine peptidase [Sphaerisporangium sp. NPDC051011]|uniref:S9 family peptidase n=1 Tax=Sphaerisporangium sp. NPDC051011 TaxID=3155792 RepID=UPI0033D9361D
MKTDLRDDRLFSRARSLTSDWLRPGSGAVVALESLEAAPDGLRAVAAASVSASLEGELRRDGTTRTRIALVDLATGDVALRTDGQGSDTSPRWSPDGKLIAYLSDRDESGIASLRILDVGSSEDRATAQVPGFAESLEWSADGRTILLGVAGLGSDIAGIQGAVAVGGRDQGPAWAPDVDGVPSAAPYRMLWVYDIAMGTARQVSPPGVNVWRGVWCGPRHVAAICSDQPDEGAWYTADVRLIGVDDGSVRTLLVPRDQLGWIAASPSGATVAVAEAVCSDRDIVAGEVRLIDVGAGTVSRPATLGADVVQLVWRGEEALLFAALQGPDSVIGVLDLSSQNSRELWRSAERAVSGLVLPRIAPLGGRPDDVLFMTESFFEAPTLVALEGGHERRIRRFVSPETAATVASLGSACDFSWVAPDGLELHGWLLTPPTPGPHALIVQIHGGPVFFSPPLYVGRSAFVQLALAEGYALFLPNVRGSSGLGQDAARSVIGDVGGADAADHLAALDALVAAGKADPDRIGVTGGSYGGFMTSWLITQSRRFAAAVTVAPTSNWVSDRFTSNIPGFFDIFLGQDPNDPDGLHLTRSPVHHAASVRTPLLSICGALDRITHPAQALEMHRALQAQGSETVLVTYPHEGHGVRSMPAAFDHVARMIAWFTAHMPARRSEDCFSERQPTSREEPTT